MDVLMNIYNILITDTYIAGKATGRIKFYEYPATADVTVAYIVIDPLSPSLDSDYADDEVIAEEYLFQIDVWTKSRTDTEELSKRIKSILRKEGYLYFAGGVNEYDKETKIYRDARRYRKKIISEEG